MRKLMCIVLIWVLVIALIGTDFYLMDRFYDWMTSGSLLGWISIFAGIFSPIGFIILGYIWTVDCCEYWDSRYNKHDYYY